MNTKDIVIAGEAAEGTGALTGWQGLGPMQRRDIVAALAEAQCPTDWAPAERSCKSHASQAVMRLNTEGYIVRAARRTDADRAIARATGKSWDARWTIARSTAATARAGESSGKVIIAVELHGDHLTFEREDAAEDLDLVSEINRMFDALRAAESYQAGDVTDWLARILRNELGAVRFGVGYYIPAGSRERAGRLLQAISGRWGRDWIYPLLPVATSEELRMGIARGLHDEVMAIVDERHAEHDKAIEAKRANISAAVAARLLGEATKVKDRVAAYRVLCGDRINASVALLMGLAEELGKLTDATSLRGALLELDAIEDTAPAVAAPSPAERAADRALEERRSGFKPARRAMSMPLPRAEDQPSMVNEIGDVIDPHSDTSTFERGALLEWD